MPLGRLRVISSRLFGGFGQLAKKVRPLKNARTRCQARRRIQDAVLICFDVVTRNQCLLSGCQYLGYNSDNLAYANLVTSLAVEDHRNPEMILDATCPFQW